MIDVCLLGCGGMLPLPRRFLTSLLLRHNGKNILIDCGESTQVALQLCRWSAKNIDHILITHFHGDHVAGLPGLLMTMGNSSRTEPVHIWGGKGLEHILKGLFVICPQLPFQVVAHQLSVEQLSTFSLGEIEVTALPVEHKIPCLAYSLQLLRSGKFDVEKARKLEVPVELWSKLQNGDAVVYQDKLIEPSMVLGPSRKGLKITYSTDCRPSEELVVLAKNSDLYVAEGLYGDPEKQHGAAQKGHMVFSEAATIARDAGVKTMWLTHYSPAMVEPEEFIQVARDIFAESYCGDNGMTMTLKFEE